MSTSIFFLARGDQKRCKLKLKLFGAHIVGVEVGSSNCLVDIRSKAVQRQHECSLAQWHYLELTKLKAVKPNRLERGRPQPLNNCLSRRLLQLRPEQ